MPNGSVTVSVASHRASPALAGARGRIVGRQGEVRRLDELVGAARVSRGGALVLRGEAGIGKSTLLDHARRAASGFQIVEASGSQYEMELPFAALHQLCVPLLSHLDELPAQHREALQVAFGLISGAPDMFRIGLATLELLAAAASDGPLLCLIDDAQWLDTASSKALAFVARRVGSEQVAIVLALRSETAAGELDELPHLSVGGLNDLDARSLLTARSHLTLDDQVGQRIMAEARGNPLALLELPTAGGFDAPDLSFVPTRIERGFQARLPRLADEARLLLTIASADPTGDPGLLWPAARLLEIDPVTVGAAAAATGLVEFSTRVRFCHPLARSAVYRAADPDLRRTAHRVLAEVTNADADPDRRAWHRAQACTGPDDDVADELDRSASRARARGGVVAAAAFIERSAALSTRAPQRIDRTLAAVQAHLDAAATDTAANLLTSIENVALDELQLTRIDLLRGQIAYVRHSDGNGPTFVLRAARRLAESDPARARECVLDALEMSLVVGRAGGVMDMALAAAQDATLASQSPDTLQALTRLATDGHRVGVPLIREVLDGDDGPLWTQRPALAIVLAAELWDPQLHDTIVDWLMKTGRESGSPHLLRLGLAQTTSNAALTGDFGKAMEAIAEEEAIADAIGGPPVFYHRLQLAAMRGRRQEALELFETATAAAAVRGASQQIANVHWAEAVLNNGLANYPAALTAARRASADGELYLAGISLSELIEAAMRCGEPELAATALKSLTERTEASGTTFGLGVAAYARGLVTGVEDHYREAVERLEESPLLPYRARARLLYGEWLRREGRRRDCREHLHIAHELLSGAGLEAFAQRAADELRATGDKVRNRSTSSYDQLTLQETCVARLVATGATTNEVAGRLFISPRTVDAHLRAIFRKLGISSRRELRNSGILDQVSGTTS
ncbi:AAA family ATPase [Kribbella sp. DT2]|uniref:AAA family ATPase n=1 Tax=Kribbella sp. DT2 TaxID=3393427 RepID=UPI003CEDAB9F